MKQFTQKLTLLILLFAGTIAYSFQSSLEEYHLLGVNMNLEQTLINGNAKRLMFKNIDEVNANVKGAVKESNIELLINHTPFILEDLGSFFAEMQNAKLVEFDFENGQKNLRIEASRVETTSSKRTLLTGVQGSCHIQSNGHTEFEKFLINTCTSNSNIGISEFKQNKNNFVENVLGLKGNGETRLTNLSLQVSGHNLRLKVKVHASLTVTAKIEGHVEYLGSKDTVALRIDKARASFLDIKKKIFEEVEQMDDPNLTVERPYIYYRLSETK